MRGVLYKIFSALGEGKVRRLEADSRNPRQAQLRKLNEILANNSKSRFGREHNFASIRTWADFNSTVRVRDYEQLRPYIDALTNGEKQVLTTEAPTMFATTSGTTDKPKFIPITPGYIKEFRAASVVSGYFLLKNFPGIARGTALAMTSPAVEGRTPCGIPYGSISGSLFKNEPLLIKKFISPIPYEVYLIKDYESKYYTLLRAALGLPVSFVYTLNPSTIQLLCRRLSTYGERLIEDIRNGTTTPPSTLDTKTLEALRFLNRPDPQRARELELLWRNDRFTPQHVWPSLEVVSCWTRAAAAFYLSDFPQYFGNRPVCDITYGASEGRGTVFLSPEKQMLAIHSHFFEFIPEDEIESEKPAILLADELQVGSNYYILFTTSGGLYRYNINDVVKVTGFHNQTPLLEFQYKSGNVSSFTGEKITELQVTRSMSTVLDTAAFKVRFFTVIPQFRPEPHYDLWMESDQSSDLRMLPIEGTDGSQSLEAKAEAIASAFDRRLALENVEYEAKRASGRLAPVTFRLLKPGTYEEFRRFLVSRGTPDSQIKISHLNPKNETREFLEQRLEAPLILH
ncbi:MAG: GH3 auxin-responsive promoter family protein [Candidatus Obscuribacterales bacterium]|nr:GH3 auxin-responsive promoter family protein [Candidatus Obscuribacterales bacterium]